MTDDIAELNLADERFRLAVEAWPNGMVMFDGAGTMVLANAAIERQFGHSRADLIGQSVEMLLPARLRSLHTRRREELGRSPEHRRIGAGPDYFGLRKDGAEFPIEFDLTPVRTGPERLVLGVVVDVSERKHVEQLKDEFVSTVSHELRTPMTSIAGSLGLLVGQWTGKLPESAARLLTIAHKNSQRLVRLVNDILDIERIESGRVVFSLRRIDVRPLIEQAIENNNGFAASYGVRVLLDTASVDGAVNADPDRLLQVITNLLSNAIKFSPPDGEVRVTVENSGETIRISVRDNGPGIPEAFRPRIFGKFAQADATSSRQMGGTGLGLSIVKQIVERLDGVVGFEDAAGGGTVFHVDLPIWDGVTNQEIDLQAAPDAIRILLCEDNRDAMISLRQRLRKAGFAADFAYTAAAAVACADATRYAAILIDLQLPDSDGIGLVMQMRAQAQYHDTPIIVVSGDPSLGRDDERSLRLNILEWLSKPVDFEHLVQVLKSSIAAPPPGRPRVLHIDDDPDVLAVVTQALNGTADVISAGSMQAAREALATGNIDLVVLDISLGADSGLDLLPDIRDSNGNELPVVIFSGREEGLASDKRVLAALTKSRASLDNLASTVRDRLAQSAEQASRKVA